MGLHDTRPCPCGSGQNSYWISDARGIPVARVCPVCEEKKLAPYREDIFTDAEYWSDEPIDG